MNLKELIKQLTREILDEESSSSGAGGYMTSNSFSPKGQGENAATKSAKKQGFTVTNESEVDFKIGDIVKYESNEWKIINIFDTEYRLEKQPSPNVKSNVIKDQIKRENPEGPKSIKESDYDKASPSSDNPSLYSKASGYTGVGRDNHVSTYYKENMSESLINIVKEELLNEVTYHKFKNEVKFRTKNEQLHKAIREVKRKLSEIDRIVEYTSRMKQELSEGEEGLKYWKNTEKNVATISEMVNILNNKIKNLQQ